MQEAAIFRVGAVGDRVKGMHEVSVREYCWWLGMVFGCQRNRTPRKGMMGFENAWLNNRLYCLPQNTSHALSYLPGTCDGGKYWRVFHAGTLLMIMHACRKVYLSSSTILVLKQDHDGIGVVEVCGCNFVEKATIFEHFPRGAIDRSGASKIRT